MILLYIFNPSNNKLFFILFFNLKKIDLESNVLEEFNELDKRKGEVENRKFGRL